MADTELIVRVAASGAGRAAKDVLAVQEALSKVSSEAKDAKAFAAALGKTLNLPADEVQDLADAMTALKREAGEAKTEVGGLENILQGIGQGIGQKGIDLLVGSLQRLGDGFTAVVTGAAEQVAAFDDARAAASTLTDDTDTLIRNLEQAQSGLKNQVGTTDLLAASYDVLSSGFTDAADAAAVTEQAARGAIAGFSDTATVADALTSILNAYGKEAGDAATVVDQLVKTQDLGKITIDQYAQQIGKAASIAAQSGVSFEEFSGAVAAATAKGVPAESAVSGIRQAIVNLLKPTSDGQALLEKYGIANATATLKAEGLVGVLQRLADQGATSDELGKIFSDTDALASVATIAGANIEDFKDSISGIEGAVGTADVAIEKITDTINGQRKALEVSIQEGLLDFGKAFEPAFEGVLSLLNDVFAAAGEASNGFDPLIEAGERLQVLLEGNPEIAERLGEAFGSLADRAIEGIAGIVDAITAFLSDQNNIDQYAQSIEMLGGAITGIGNTIEFIIALVDGILQLQAAAEGLPIIGGIIDRLMQPFGQFALMGDLVRGLADVFVQLRDTVVDSVQNTVDAVGEAFPALQPLLNQVERILDLLGRKPDTTAFTGSIGDGAKQAEDALNGAKEKVDELRGAVENAGQDKPPLPTPTPDDAAEAESVYERLANANRTALQQIETDSTNSRAALLENGGTQEELAASEADALRQRVEQNRAFLAELQALQSSGTLDAEESKKVADAITQVEGQLAKDRVSAAQATVEAEKKAQEARVKAAQEAAKKITDALKEEREEQKRLAEEDFELRQDRQSEAFDDAAQRREQQFQDQIQAQEKAFQDQLQADAEAFQDQQNAEQESFQKRQQEGAKAFQRSQQAEAEAFQKRLDAERERGNREFDALASEVERRVALANASSAEERKALKEQFKQEDAATKQRSQIERQVLGQRSSVLGQADQRGELELSPLEQARADFEAELQEKEKAFQEEQKLAEEAFQLAQQEQEKVFQLEQQQAQRDFEAEQELVKAEQELAKREAQRAFDEEERGLQRAFEEQQRLDERAFKEEQRRLDLANAQRIAAILRAAQASGGRVAGARANGGPVLGGNTYLVGEKGPELVTFGRNGYVHTAKETAAMLAGQRFGVGSVATPSSQGIEQRLDALIAEVRSNRQLQVGGNQITFINEPDPHAQVAASQFAYLKQLVKHRGL